MNKDRNIFEELKSLDSRLALLPKLQPFQGPEAGYFAALAAVLADGIRAAESADPLADWGSLPAFDVPEGYFRNLPQSLARKAVAQDARAFEVPQDYFARLPEELMAGIKASETPEASAPKTVPFRRPLRKAIPWLAAAAILAGVWIGVRPGSVPLSPERQAVAALAALDRDSIGAYVERHADEFDPESLEAALAGGDETDVKRAVSELPADEINDYLNDTGPEAPAPDGS